MIGGRYDDCLESHNRSFAASLFRIGRKVALEISQVNLLPVSTPHFVWKPETAVGMANSIEPTSVSDVRSTLSRHIIFLPEFPSNRPMYKARSPRVTIRIIEILAALLSAGLRSILNFPELSNPAVG